MGLLNTRFIAIALIGTALCLGCSTRLDRHWGEATNGVVAMQIAHPHPAEAELQGDDGVSAEKAMESHRAGDAQTNAPQQSLIMVGSGSDD